jgi:flagellar biosynthesis/type III secretory pathway protein FliH
MGKKKQAAKMAAPPALTPQFPEFDTELSTALENEHNQAERKLASDIATIRVYQNNAYKVILKIGRAETLTIAQEAIQRTIRNARMATLEEGRREGHEKGLKEGEE